MLEGMWDTHVKDTGKAICDSSWSLTHGVTSDMEFADTLGAISNWRKYLKYLHTNATVVSITICGIKQAKFHLGSSISTTVSSFGHAIYSSADTHSVNWGKNKVVR